MARRAPASGSSSLLLAVLLGAGGCSGGRPAAAGSAGSPGGGGSGAMAAGTVAAPAGARSGATGGQADAAAPLPDAGGRALDASEPGGDSGATAAAGDTGPILGPPIEAPTPVGCVTDVSAGLHEFACDTTIDTVAIPQACTHNACGVIVDVHGGMMSSQMEDKNTGLRALGMQHGYIVIQPNALQNPLLLDQRMFVADAPGMPADDTRVMDILTQVIQAFHVDEKRIHMTGFSEGGFMSWRWFCAHSDLLASVAVGAAAWQCGVLANAGLTPPEVGCELAGSDVPARDIPVLYMQGMQDGLVDPACADGWVHSNLLPALRLGAGTVIAGDPSFASAAYVRTRYLDPDGVPFEYLQHQYTTDSSFLGVGLVGHCYPGSTDLTATPAAQTVIPPDQLIPFGCKDQCDFDWGQEAIAFFIAHPKP